jgi:hypothetical protein
MGGSSSHDPFDDAAQNAHDAALARGDGGDAAAAAATAVYARKAMYESGRDGAVPEIPSLPGALFDLATAGIQAAPTKRN